MVRCSCHHLPAEAAKVQPIIIFLLLVDAAFVAMAATAIVGSLLLCKKVKP
jgi:hypothetical protein